MELKLKLIIPFNREQGGKVDAARIEKTKELLSYCGFSNMYITFINKDMPTALTLEIYDNDKGSTILDDICKIWSNKTIYQDVDKEIFIVQN